MVDVPKSLDDAIARFDVLVAEFNEKIDECELVQKAGRSGIEEYRLAKRMGDDLNAYTVILKDRIDKALGDL